MKRKLISTLRAIFPAAVLVLTAAGCAGGAPISRQNDDSLQKVLDAGQLILGLDVAFPPMGFADEDGGELVGFDIDAAASNSKTMVTTDNAVGICVDSLASITTCMRASLESAMSLIR